MLALHIQHANLSGSTHDDALRNTLQQCMVFIQPMYTHQLPELRELVQTPIVLHEVNMPMMC